MYLLTGTKINNEFCEYLYFDSYPEYFNSFSSLFGFLLIGYLFYMIPNKSAAAYDHILEWIGFHSWWMNAAVSFVFHYTGLESAGWLDSSTLLTSALLALAAELSYYRRFHLLNSLFIPTLLLFQLLLLVDKVPVNLLHLLIPIIVLLIIIECVRKPYSWTAEKTCFLLLFIGAIFYLASEPFCKSNEHILEKTWFFLGIFHILAYTSIGIYFYMKLNY